MDHPQHERLDARQLIGTMLDGATIHDETDDTVGTMSHVHGVGQEMKVVADVGMYLGMFGRSVVIPVSALQFMRDGNGSINAVTTWTKAQIEQLPEHGDH